MILMVALLAVTGETDDLEQRLAAVSGGLQQDVAYREERHSELFAEPLISTGQLSYDRSQRAMIKRVTTPKAATMTVTERHILVETGGRGRRLSLRSRPEMRALLGGFRALIEGDLEQLESQFQARYEQHPEGRWKIHLTPLHRKLARQVEAIIVDGQDDWVQAICTRLSNGDWQHLEFLHEQ
jgi:hypothetical protein